ncbi:hypothetical protein ACIO3O_37680 [Streptomyces sp. NPDC087440]|uniref:hypothetical protein n=1 Tax=Streptomyces sp. NPDC087440 TaxID=3365790 RepID=UPI0038175A64
MFALAATAPPSAVPWVLTAVLAALVVFFIGFYGSQKPKPVGLGVGFYPALFCGAGAAAVTLFGLVELFSKLHLL